MSTHVLPLLPLSTGWVLITAVFRFGEEVAGTNCAVKRVGEKLANVVS